MACSISKAATWPVHNPELTFATPDHAISTARGRAGTSKVGQELLAGLRTETSATGIRMFDIDEPGQGIVHVIGPELGLSLPGCLIVCGDSHTCTHGGLGALAFGIGSSELTHVLATQALIQRRPKTMRVRFEGRLPARRHRQGPDPRSDRSCRRRGRHRLRGRVCRQRHSRSAGRGPAHHLQSVDRTRRQDGPDRAGREDVRISARARPMRRRARCGSRRLRRGENCRAIPMRCSTAKSSSMSRRSFRR